ncbi:MAG: hypothetical protein AAF066_13855 [Pseudomonadota bacterium]
MIGTVLLLGFGLTLISSNNLVGIFPTFLGLLFISRVVTFVRLLLTFVRNKTVVEVAKIHTAIDNQKGAKQVEVETIEGKRFDAVAAFKIRHEVKSGWIGYVHYLPAKIGQREFNLITSFDRFPN